MATIKPFAGWRYSPRGYGQDPGAVTAPPYDVIDEKFQGELYRRNPHNIIRLILPREDDREKGSADRYESVALRLRKWREEGVIAPDPTPRIYLYEQTFRFGNGPELTRRGFLALIRLEEFSRGEIRPHEKTLARPREDRLRLLRATRANLSPVFFCYSDPEGELEFRLRPDDPDVIRFTDEMGVVHRFGYVDRQDLVEKYVTGISRRTLFIADGHHRYSSALDHFRENPEAGPEAGYTLGFYTRVEDPGLLILPTHRMIKAIPGLSDREALARIENDFSSEAKELPPGVSEGEIADWINRENQEGGFAFALLSAGSPGIRFFRLRPGVDLNSRMTDIPEVVRPISTAILDSLVLGNLLGVAREEISYTSNPLTVIQGLREGKYQKVFIPRAVSPAEILLVTEKGEICPPKTTFFHPKLRSGLVMRIF